MHFNSQIAHLTRTVAPLTENALNNSFFDVMIETQKTKYGISERRKQS